MMSTPGRSFRSTLSRVQSVFLVVIVLVTILAGSLPAGAQTVEPVVAPTIESDKPDYAPGELVTLTGSNWQPGENVHIVVNDDQGQTWRRDVDVVAGAGGNIADAFNLPDWFVALYTVTATGPLSGTTSTTFTDANFRFLSSGPTLSSIGWQKYSNSSCTTALVGPGNSGSGSITTTDSSPGTLQIPAVNNQWIGLTAPATAGGQSFVDWEGISGTPTFTTSGPGNRTICVAGDNSSGLRRLRANYAAANQTPVANDDTYSTDEDTTLNVTAPGVLSNDTDGDGDSLTVTATSPIDDVDDGTLTLNGNGSFSYDPDINFHGSDSFTYRATDGTAASNVATVSITVNPVNDVPVAVDDSANTPEDTPKGIDVVANDTDVEGDNLSVDGASISDPAHGTATLITSGADAGKILYTPDADSFGPDSFTYVVCDDGTTNGVADPKCSVASATVSVTVLAVNDAPVAGDDSANTPEDTPKGIDVVANDTDVEGDNLSVDGGSISDPAHGTATLITSGADAGKILYTPDADSFGPDSFTYVVCDDGTTNGVADPKCSVASATVSVTVLAVNDAPVAGDDSANTPEDTPKAIVVVANDTDVEGDNLSVDGASISAPAHGTATLITSGPDAGRILYTPDADSFGPDSFTYKVCDDGTSEQVDGLGVVAASADPKCSATATVAITVTEVNDPPVAGDDTATVAEDSSNNAIDVLANDSPGPANESSQAPKIDSITDAPDHGTTTIDDGGTPANPTDDVIRYTPAANYFGPDSLTYRVCDDGTTDGLADPQCDTADVVITVTAVNDAPEVTADADQTIDENGTASVSATFTDVEAGDSHTCTISWGDGSPTAGTVVEPSGGMPGSCSGSHQYLDDNPTGTTGDDDTVIITVTDNGTTNGAPDPQSGNDSLTVTVNNVVPTTSNPALTVNSFTGEVTASFDFSDVGTLDSHTASLTWSHGAAGLGPSDTNTNPGTATETRTLPPGCYSLTVSGSVTDDDLGASNPQAIATDLQVDVYSLAFAPPIQEDERNIAKYGNVVPVKVRAVSSCTGSPVTSGPLYLTYIQGTGTETTGTETIAESVSSADGTGGQMRTADGMYIYNFTTRPLSQGKDYTLRVRHGSATGPVLLSAVLQPKK